MTACLDIIVKSKIIYTFILRFAAFVLAQFTRLLHLHVCSRAIHCASYIYMFVLAQFTRLLHLHVCSRAIHAPRTFKLS